MSVARTPTDPYTQLARGYDAVMAHVDYDSWAVYLHQFIEAHHPSPQTLLELGCGTGTLGFALQPLGPYAYHGTDKARAMITEARRKASGTPLTFGVADFTDFTVEDPVDVVLLVYDGLNYLLQADDVARLLDAVHAALAPGGLFIFDQSTPWNSLNNEDFFTDEGETEAFRYRRYSAYDPRERVHVTAFDLYVEDQVYHERHVQRAYELQEVQALVDASPFVVRARYADFTVEDADANSERILWVLQRPEA